MAVMLSQGIRALGVYNGTIQAWLNTLTCRLFQNSHVPAVTDGNGAYTQATFSGYAALGVSSWGAPTLDAANNDLYTASDQTFSHNGGGTANQIYGVYWTDPSGLVVMAEENGVSGGVPMTGSGYTYVVSPAFYSGQILPPL